MQTLKLMLCLMVAAPLSMLAQSKGEMPFTGSPEANKLLRKSWVALADFNTDEANNYTRQVLAQDPGMGMAYASLFSDNPDEVTANLHKAEGTKLSQDELLFIQGVLARRSNQSPQQYFDPLLKKYPKDLYLQLWILFNSNDFKRSIEIGESIVKRNPKFAPAYNMLGYAYMEQKDMAKAEAHFDKYIALQPNLPNPYDSKGDYLMRMGKIEEAIPLYEKAFAMGMNQSEEKIERARALLKFPAVSKEDASTIEGIMIARFDGTKRADLDGILNDYSEQAIEIFDNQRVNVGLPNIRRRMSELRQFGAHLNHNFVMGSVHGSGPIAVAHGKSDFTWKVLNTGHEDPQKRDAIFLLRKDKENNWKIIATHFYEPGDALPDDKDKINQLLKAWEASLGKGEKTTEKHMDAFSQSYSQQAVEIFPNQVSNIGMANLRSRLQQMEGTAMERNTLGALGIEVRGRKAVAWGIGNQHYYPKDSKELRKNEFPWAMILTREKDDVWRILAIHWGGN